MMLEHLAAEIAISPPPQEYQKKHWLRWGMAGNIAGAILFATLAFKVAMTGEDPPIGMIVIALALSLVGIALTTIGRLLAPP